MCLKLGCSICQGSKRLAPWVMTFQVSWPDKWLVPFGLLVTFWDGHVNGKLKVWLFVFANPLQK